MIHFLTTRERAVLDPLADLMAEGCPTLSEAARRLGIRQQTASKRWAKIRAHLGEQAR